MSVRDKIFFTKYPSWAGMLTLASDGGSLVGLWIEGQKYEQAAFQEAPVRDDGLEFWILVRRWLDSYFSGGKPLPGQLPLHPAGSLFQQLVWKLLCEIPYGEVTTYGALAQKAAAGMGRKTMSARAVGGAVGHNPISIVIPCHRVIGADGTLTGYAGEIDIKRRLLEWEGNKMGNFRDPFTAGKKERQ